MIELNDNENITFASEMTLKDYFAAHAMQGLLSNPKLEKRLVDAGGAKTGWIEINAYAYAEAMMEAREKDCR
jgi:hypothetical protein